MPIEILVWKSARWKLFSFQEIIFSIKNNNLFQISLSTPIPQLFTRRYYARKTNISKIFKFQTVSLLKLYPEKKKEEKKEERKYVLTTPNIRNTIPTTQKIETSLHKVRSPVRVLSSIYRERERGKKKKKEKR